MAAVEQQLQKLDEKYRARTLDGVHDMLIALGDLSGEEIVARSLTIDAAEAVPRLVASRRAIHLRVAGDARVIAVEDAARFRDALGVPLPLGIPEALLEPVRDPIGDLALRYARTHAPFPAADFAARYALGQEEAEQVLTRLASEGHLLEGEFRPGGTRREWTDAGVLRMIRRRSLAKIRHEIEPVDHSALARFTTGWQGVSARRKGADALLDAIEQLQGAPLAASIVETEILPARIELYDPADLDAVISAGEVVWVGVEPLGERNGRMAFYLADHVQRLMPPTTPDAPLDARETAIVHALAERGALFFGALHDAAGAGYPRDTVDALWNLVWRGLVTNDTFHALRAFTRAAAPSRRKGRTHAAAAPFRSRRVAPPSAEGRWTLVPRREVSGRDAGKQAAVRANTERMNAVAQQLLARHGVLTREAVAAEAVPGGFGAVYPVLKAMDDSGRLRRGYFVAGLGATQFALPGALDLLRSMRDPKGDDRPDVVAISATDPANPYGAVLPWPTPTQARPDTPGRGPTRSVGATVILVDGRLGAYLARGDRLLVTWLPDAEPERSRVARAVAQTLIERARSGGDAPRGMLIEDIDGAPPDTHALAPFLTAVGFAGGAMGFQATFRRAAPPARELAGTFSDA